MRVVAHRVGGGDPAEKLAHLAVSPGPQDQVPVVGHQLVREQLDLIPLEPRGEDVLEGGEVLVFAEDRGPRVPSVQGMIQPSGFVGAWRSWHAGSLTDSPKGINES